MYDEVRRLGGNAIMYRTGHSLIKAKMKEVHAELAGEMSGHMFFADRYYGFDDALYAACRLIEILARSGQPLAAQLADLPKMVSTPELRVDCSDEKKFEVVQYVVDHYRKIRKVIDVDGARVLFDGGWGLVRASNTQPILVMRFEARNAELLGAYRKGKWKTWWRKRRWPRASDDAQFFEPTASVRPASGFTTSPPQTPTPVSTRALRKLKNTA